MGPLMADQYGHEWSLAAPGHQTRIREEPYGLLVSYSMTAQRKLFKKSEMQSCK